MPVSPGSFEYQFSPSTLAKVRSQLSLSQAKLAGRLEVPVNTVSRWERGETTPDAHSLAAIYSIAKEHGLTPEFFHKGDDMVQIQLGQPMFLVTSDCMEVIRKTKGKAIRMADLGQSFKNILDKHGVEPQGLGFNKNHPTKSLLAWLEEQKVITVKQVSGGSDSVVLKQNGNPKITSVEEKRKAKTKKHFTIQRKGRSLYERTIVGKDGKCHKDETDKKGKDDHFTDEGKYRRAIEQAVRQNSNA